jgi:hypothetical protein
VYGERLPFNRKIGNLREFDDLDDEEDQEGEEYQMNGNAQLHSELLRSMIVKSGSKLDSETRDFRGCWLLSFFEDLQGFAMVLGELEKEKNEKSQLNSLLSLATEVETGDWSQSPIEERGVSICLTTDDHVVYHAGLTIFFGVQKDGILALSGYPYNSGNATSALFSSLWCSLWWKKSETELTGYWVMHRPGACQKFAASPSKWWRWGTCQGFLERKNISSY